MKLIFVNRFFYPDHSATAQILADLCFALADRGYDVHVITSRISYDGERAELPVREYVRGVTVHRLSSTAFGGKGIWGKFCDYLSFYFLSLVCLMRVMRAGDVVVAKSDPPLLSVFVAPLAWFKKAKLINWLQDLYPEVADRLEVGGWAVRGLFSIIRGMRNWSLKFAELNVVPGQLMSDYLQSQGVPDDRLYVIQNWADGDDVYSVEPDDNALRNEWGLRDKFVVGYSGNFGRAHDFETIMRAAQILGHMVDGKDVIFLFIGGGAQHQYVRNRMQSEGIDNIYLKPYQPRSLLSLSLSASDVHLISLRCDLEGCLVPSKFYGIAAAGRATLFVGSPDGEIPNVLREHEIGKAIAEGDAQALVSEILSLKDQPAQCLSMGNRARGVFDLCFDKRIAIRKWEVLLGNVGRL